MKEIYGMRSATIGSEFKLTGERKGRKTRKLASKRG